MNQAIYDKLLEVARKGKTITYAEVAEAGDLEADQRDGLQALVRELELIADKEVKAGRPLLVVLVVSPDTGAPGKGLFKWAKQKKVNRGEDEITFFITEMRRVHEYWKNAPE